VRWRQTKGDKGAGTEIPMNFKQLINSIVSAIIAAPTRKLPAISRVESRADSSSC